MPPSDGGGRLERNLAEMPAEENWDSYGAHPTTQAAKDAVLAFHVCPTNRGGIVLSWKGEDVYVEFGPDGECRCVSWEASDGPA